MKKRLLFFALAVGSLNAAQAQDVFTIRVDGMGTSSGGATLGSAVKEIAIGTANQEFFYDYRRLQDTTDREKITEDIMVLQVGSELSKFFSYRKLQSDSLLRATPPEQVLADPSKFIARGAQSYTIYKNLPAGTLSYTDKISRDNLRYEEEIPAMEWQLLDESKIVEGYTCYRAECDFRGRRYVAWYTPEIPISNGPWKFGGLPGLILEAVDSEGHHSFALNGIRNVTREITQPDLQYHQTPRVRYLRTLRQFESDPIGYMSANSGANVIIRKPDGSNFDEAMSAREIHYDYLETDYK